MSERTHTHTHVIDLNRFVCVCVCVCACARARADDFTRFLVCVPVLSEEVCVSVRVCAHVIDPNIFFLCAYDFCSFF